MSNVFVLEQLLSIMRLDKSTGQAQEMKEGGALRVSVTRQEIEKQMHELARMYVETHDSKIIKELYKLGCELEKMEKLEKQ